VISRLRSEIKQNAVGKIHATNSNIKSKALSNLAPLIQGSLLTFESALHISVIYTSPQSISLQASFIVLATFTL